jgi:cysteine-rich repeat protein
MHCIFNACVKNACGDGYSAGNEECDDGNQVDGDGCSARCTDEVCGNSIVETSEDCDNGQQNGKPDGGCTGQCRFVDGTMAARDAGAADAGSGRVCPESGGLMASSMHTPLAVALSGPEVMGASYLWYIAGDGTGKIGAPEAANTGFICQGQPGPRTIRRITSKDGCSPVQSEVTFECTGADPGLDAGQVDSGDEAGSAADSGSADSGTQVDSSSPMDAQSPPDAASHEAGAADFTACMTCMTNSCSELPDQALTNVAPVCFQNSPDGIIQAMVQPKTTQDCTDAVHCSITAADGCLRGDRTYSPAVAVGDPTLCYCGHQDPNTCTTSGPLANAACKHQWEVASKCDSVSDAVLRNQCVSGAIADLTTGAGYAYYILGCAATTCASQCGVAP